MGFLSWSRKSRKELEEEYKNYPSGYEIVNRYNTNVELEQLNPGKSWLAYIGDNK
jgi:hypothetical protein